MARACPSGGLPQRSDSVRGGLTQVVPDNGVTPVSLDSLRHRWWCLEAGAMRPPRLGSMSPGAALWPWILGLRLACVHGGPTVCTERPQLVSQRSLRGGVMPGSLARQKRWWRRRTTLRSINAKQRKAKEFIYLALSRASGFSYRTASLRKISSIGPSSRLKVFRSIERSLVSSAEE